ncbi:dirigent protein 21-like [Magnolia sinica]|uniref:dirigent protein 21-like n=1 Tax=Magnolia sinica TaxID=86752 RepID=UPI00265929DF|nr:dirigent protein 21-like [Magnolia sinica]
MAGLLSKFHSAFIIFFFLFVVAFSTKPQPPSEIPRPAFGFGKEKMTHLRFYFHDIVSGPNPTAVLVAAASSTNKSRTGFGGVSIIDDPLTEGPDPKSKLLGRAQGLYASASQEEVGLLMALNFVFVDGKYNQSIVSILGRNSGVSKVREMPVVGGSGIFRFARGYAKARTHTFNVTSGNAVVEYSVYVMHY